MENKLIVFEGIDGVGKTTLARRLKHKLLAIGIDVIFYDDDIEDKYSGFNLIKPYIKNQVPFESSFLFYLASSANKSKIISKLLKKHWVICDRYVYSTIAYHRTRGSKLALNIDLNLLPIVKPDCLFQIIVDEETRLSRITKRESNCTADYTVKTKYNRLGLFERELKKFNPMLIDNTNCDIDETINNMLNLIKTLLTK